MFTGLVEEIGTIGGMVKGKQSSCITIHADTVLEDVKLGDSIAVNGICLTVTGFTKDTFSVDAMPETMHMTTLHKLKVHDQVHLERALQVGGRLGGHMMSGHIDGIGTIRSFIKEDNAVRMTVTVPSHLQKYMVHKGSIAMDGVSLTITKVKASSFQVGIIPMTGQVTLLLQKKMGDKVNIECDMMGKYVEKLYEATYEKQVKSLDEDYLRLNGFI